jgi:hypothetical protein
MNQDELKQKIQDKLERDYMEKRKECLELYNEIKTFEYANRSSFFKISTQDGVNYSWSADLIRSKIPIKL